MKLPPEILKKVKLIELNTRKIVKTVLTGEYHSTFKGQGMTFSEFREYVHGDDIRHISWNITAKAGRPYIKQYEEERELSTVLVVDVSASGDYGSGEYPKGEIMVHLAALLGFAAVENGDQVGLCLFSDQVEHFVPPKKGRANIHRILRDLLYLKPQSKKTCLKNTLDYLQGILRKQSNIFIISDFYDEGFELSLQRLARKHDVTAIAIQDNTELEMPKMGVLDFVDAETGELITVNTSAHSFQKALKTERETAKAKLERLFRKSAVGSVFISDSKNYIDPLIAYFRKRHR